MHTPRWKEIANSISAEIDSGRLSSGDPLPSEVDLALLWQVSRVTAHRAMHELQQQGIVVRRRRIGSVVAAQNRRKTGNVAVFLNTGDFLEQQYLSGIRTGLPDAYHLMFCDIRSDAEREAQYMDRMALEADGILCIPTCDPVNNDVLQRVVKSGCPIVCLDCVPADIELDAIITDNYGATLHALRYLTGKGHKNIAHFTVLRNSLSSVRERFNAYRDAMREVGNHDYERLVREFPFDLEISPSKQALAVQDALYTLLHRKDPPTAIFCVHDYVLSSVLHSCTELGLSIPEDLEIVSFNDCPPLEPFMPGNISRIVQQAHEMGQLAAEKLCRKMQGEVMAPEVLRVSPVFCAG